MTDFNINRDAGYPKSRDHVTTGSELTGTGVPSDPAMNMNAPSAAISPNQQDGETKPIGMPGSTWAPNVKDKIIHTEGGHTLAFGHAAGQETILLRHKNGAQVEIGKDGEIKIMSKSGMHFGINGEGQIVATADILITAPSLKIKVGTFVLDATDVHYTIAGNKVEKIHGTQSQDIMGDSHAMIHGDQSNMVGGSERKTVGGDSKTQISGASAMHVAKTAEMKSGNNMTISTKGEMKQASDKSFNVATKDSITTTSEKDMTLKSGGNKTLATKGNFVAEINGNNLTYTEGTRERHVKGNDVKAIQGTQFSSATSAYGYSGNA